jgi:hypothetical protein
MPFHAGVGARKRYRVSFSNLSNFIEIAISREHFVEKETIDNLILFSLIMQNRK